MRFLIVGYGSAGRRHEQTLMQTFGVSARDIVTVDPNARAKADYESYWDAMIEADPEFDVVVIASPPNAHIKQIEAALDYGAHVLCEKPLCGIGQLEMVSQLCERSDCGKIAVAYNYRFSPSLDTSAFVTKGAGKNWWYLKCIQHRPSPPAWGILLDHLSHDFDIIISKSGLIPEIVDVEHSFDGTVEAWDIDGNLGSGKFQIIEMVDFKNQIRRQAILSTPIGWTSISADPVMYQNMWQRFLYDIELGLAHEPSLSSALVTQRLLEEVAGWQK